jgi:dihydropyrimidinase
MIKLVEIYDPNEKISSNKNFEKVFDAQGRYVMPGGIDPHVHLRTPLYGHNSSR